MMWGNIQSINKMMDEPPKPKHPEAPAPGDEVMYIDVSDMNSKQFADQKNKLEDLYKKNKSFIIHTIHTILSNNVIQYNF